MALVPAMGKIVSRKGTKYYSMTPNNRASLDARAALCYISGAIGPRE
jgi:hypothetical protein